MGHRLDTSDPVTFERWCSAPVDDARTLEEFAADGGPLKCIRHECAHSAEIGAYCRSHVPPRNPNRPIEAPTGNRGTR